MKPRCKFLHAFNLAAAFAVLLLAAAARSQVADPGGQDPDERSLAEGDAARTMTAAQPPRPAGWEQPHRIEINGIAETDMRLADPVSTIMNYQTVVLPNDPRSRINPGRVEYKPIKISGVLPPKDMILWFRDVRDGKDDRRAGQIILQDSALQEDIYRIEFRSALPVALDFDLANSRWTMTLVAESIDYFPN